MDRLSPEEEEFLADLTSVQPALEGLNIVTTTDADLEGDLDTDTRLVRAKQLTLLDSKWSDEHPFLLPSDDPTPF